MIISSSTTCVGSVLDDEERWTHTSSVSSCGLNILSSYLIMIIKLSNIKLRAHFSLMFTSWFGSLSFRASLLWNVLTAAAPDDTGLQLNVTRPPTDPTPVCASYLWIYTSIINRTYVIFLIQMVRRFLEYVQNIVVVLNTQRNGCWRLWLVASDRQLQ